MDRILSFGGGLQTTALAIMVAQGQVEVDAVVFADTGGEKPETYWYIEEYIKPLFIEAGVPYYTVTNPEDSHYGISLYDYFWRYRNIPALKGRLCSNHFKARPITKFVGKGAVQMIGFSAEEQHRAENPVHEGQSFPLIELGMTGLDCHRLIGDFGWPIPLKSSCFFCVFQRVWQWNWLKRVHPDLFQRAVALEANLYDRKPQIREKFGLMGGRPLWKYAAGVQPEFYLPVEDSCYSGYCSH